MKKVTVIGAGIGGLLAANLLAKKGAKVTLFEAHQTPGGYTAGFWRKGFYFESGTLSLEGHPHLFETLRSLDLYEKIAFVPQRTRIVSEDFDGIPASYEEFKELFRKSYPNAWEGYFSKMDPMVGAFSGESFWKKLQSLYFVLKYKNLSIENFVEKFFPKDSFFYSIAKRFAFSYPSAPAWMGAAALSCRFGDYWTVKNGMQKLSDILAENFLALGGELKRNSFVEKIVTEKGKVKGVVCKGSFEKADAVIAACDYKKTFLELLDDSSKVDREKIQRAEVSESVFVVYLGLKLSNEELKTFLKHHYVEVYGKKETKDPLKNESFLLYSPSLLNSELAPKGKSSLMIYCQVPWEFFSSSDTYQERKKQMKEAYIQKASRFVLGLKEFIEIQDAATPQTFERYTHNTHGASSGFSWKVPGLFYPMDGKSRVTTPIENLYIGSCWASNFGGIPGAEAAARECVKKIIG
jgi:phytoene dehydrogenase-like protein